MLGSVKLTRPGRRRRPGHPAHPLHSQLQSGCLLITCGRVRLGDGVYSVHGQRGVVLLLPLQGEHHFSQGIRDPPPLQYQTRQRVQRPELLQNILPPDVSEVIRMRKADEASRDITLVVLNCFPSRTLPAPLLP